MVWLLWPAALLPLGFRRERTGAARVSKGGVRLVPETVVGYEEGG